MADEVTNDLSRCPVDGTPLGSSGMEVALRGAQV